MILAVVGSREFNDYGFVKSKLEYLLQNISEPVTIVSGGAKGVDTLAKMFAQEKGFVMLEHYPEYHNYPPKLAPLKRNEKIVNSASTMVAFPKGKSNGTRHAIKLAQAKGINLRVIEC